eukprot:gene2708-3363_t
MATACGTGLAQVVAVLLAAAYPVWGQTDPPPLPFDPSGSSTLPTSHENPSLFRFANSAGDMANPTQNIRSGDPQKETTATIIQGVQDNIHKISGLSFVYSYNVGYKSGKNNPTFQVILTPTEGRGGTVLYSRFGAPRVIPQGPAPSHVSSCLRPPGLYYYSVGT